MCSYLYSCENDQETVYAEQQHVCHIEMMFEKFAACSCGQIQWCIQKHVKCLRWNFLRKWLVAKSIFTKRFILDV